jgi:hypothetical protein
LLLSGLNRERSGASGRDRTTDTAIFSRMLYQLSYRGIRAAKKTAVSGAPPIGKGKAACPAPNSVLLRPFFGQIGVSGRPGHPVSLTQPLQQITVLAALAAKGFVLVGFGLAA